MTPGEKEDYEGFILSERPKYIPMKPEKLAMLSPEDRQEYENSLIKDNIKHLNVTLLEVDLTKFYKMF
jgi:hypothetical protein